jgi:hypothetical protein
VIERTEELALAARLPILVGGQQVELRTLNLDESDKWLKQLDALGEVELSDLSVDEQVRIVLAYDVDNVLGNQRDARKRFTKQELYDALNQMVKAEVPFLEDARSVVMGFGQNLSPLMYQLLVRLPSEKSTSGDSPSGDSTPLPSEPGSRKKDS